jgi:hypothetical protein
MFNAWKQEKATTALIDEAQALAEKLSGAKLHILDSHAAAAQFWAASYLATGQDLFTLNDWTPAATAKFAAAAQARIATLRKQRDYDSSDGLAIWLHTARAVAEPRVAPAARNIWQQILKAGPNAESMAQDLLHDAGLPVDVVRRVPTGFETAIDQPD